MKHIYFSGIGGSGIGPLAEIAQDAGYEVSGSDLRESLVSKELESRGIDVVYQQNRHNIEAEHLINPIDWFVYSSALADKHEELKFAREQGIKASKRDDFLNDFIKEHNLELIAIAGTHGKTTTTGMFIWACIQLDIPISYSIGTTIPYSASGKYDVKSKYFIYEADEYDRNFLKFHPKLSLITSVDYDHADIYKTTDDYKSAFRQFIDQSDATIMFEETYQYLQDINNENITVFKHKAKQSEINLAGQMRRNDAYLVKQALLQISNFSEEEINNALSSFPGTNRRFEELSPNLYSDYAHHPTEIKATIDMARELSDNVIVVYEPHQNERQLNLVNEYEDVFSDAKHVYWLPTFMPTGDREKSEKVLQPEDLVKTLKNTSVETAEMGDDLWEEIEAHIANGDLVIGMSAGDLDAWLRRHI